MKLSGGRIWRWFLFVWCPGRCGHRLARLSLLNDFSALDEPRRPHNLWPAGGIDVTPSADACTAGQRQAGDAGYGAVIQVIGVGEQRAVRSRIFGVGVGYFRKDSAAMFASSSQPSGRNRRPAKATSPVSRAIVVSCIASPRSQARARATLDCFKTEAMIVGILHRGPDSGRSRRSGRNVGSVLPVQ